MLDRAVGPGIALVTLNRPERLERDELRRSSRGLYDAFDELADDRTCRVIVLTGAGRGFCAGLDLTEGASPAVGAPASGVRRRAWRCRS